MKNRGFTLVELLATIVIAAIIITLAVSGFNGISKQVKQTAYENKVSYIEVASANYGDDTGESAVFVDTLVKEGYIEPDNEDGEVLDPRDKTPMNCYVVIISYENDNVYGKFTEEEIKESDGKTCDKDKLKDKYLVVSLKLYEATNDTGTSWDKEIEAGSWTRNNVVLIAEIDNEMKSKVSKITFMSNEDQNPEERIVNKDYDSKNKKYITASQLKNIRYTVHVETKEIDSEGKEIINTYISSIRVKIDKQRPIIYDSTVVIESENDWTNNGKKVKVIASDGNGSGIYGFSISTNRDCKNASYTPSSSDSDDVYEITIENIGEYYICAKDNAGNVSEDESTKKIVIDKIDTTPPECKWGGENTRWTKDSVTITLEGVDNESGSNSIYTKVYATGAIEKEKLSYTIYDKAGNSTVCEKEVNVYLDAVVPSAPTITATDGINSGEWHNKVFDLNATYSTLTKNKSGNTFYYGKDINNLTEEKKNGGTIVEVTANTAGTTYYAKVCSGAGLCSTISNYNVKLDTVYPRILIQTSDNIYEGWHNKPFTIYFDGAGANNISGNTYYYGTKENPSTIGTSTNVTFNTKGTMYYGKVCSGAGLCSSSDILVKLDTISPTCSISGESTDWAQSRTITYGCSDNLTGSGCSATSSSATTYNTSTIKTTSSPEYTIYDNAGNSTVCYSRSVNIYVDRTYPWITFSDDSPWSNQSAYVTSGKLKYGDSDSGVELVRVCKDDNILFVKDCQNFNGLDIKIDYYSLTFNIKDKAGNASSTHGYTRYDILLPYTPRITRVYYDDTGELVNFLCNNEEDVTDEITCTIYSSGKKLSYFTTVKDQRSNYISGSSGVYSVESIHYYSDGTTCTEVEHQNDDGSWEEGPCSYTNQDKVEIYNYDQAGNKSAKLTVFFEYV